MIRRQKGQSRKLGPKEAQARAMREAQFASVTQDDTAVEADVVEAVVAENFEDDEDFDILRVDPRPAVQATTEAQPATEGAEAEEPQTTAETPAQRRARLESERKLRVAHRKAENRIARSAEREANRAARLERQAERAARKRLSPEATAAKRRVRELRAQIKAERSRLEGELPDSGGPTLSELQAELKTARAVQYEAIAEVATELSAVRARLKQLKEQKHNIIREHPSAQRVTSLQSTITGLKRARQESISDADVQKLTGLKKELAEARAAYQATRPTDESSHHDTSPEPAEAPHPGQQGQQSLVEAEDWQARFDPQALHS